MTRQAKLRAAIELLDLSIAEFPPRCASDVKIEVLTEFVSAGGFDIHVPRTMWNSGHNWTAHIEVTSEEVAAAELPSALCDVLQAKVNTSVLGLFKAAMDRLTYKGFAGVAKIVDRGEFGSIPRGRLKVVLPRFAMITPKQVQVNDPVLAETLSGWNVFFVGRIISVRDAEVAE